MIDCRGCRSYKKNTVPPCWVVAESEAQYSCLCGTAFDTVDAVRSAIPKGFKFLVVVKKTYLYSKLFFYNHLYRNSLFSDFIRQAVKNKKR